MSTAAQTNANQQNAALSTGPSSPEGKAVSSRNATTHGLTGNFAVLPHEDNAEFEGFMLGYLGAFQPRNHHEFFLVERMVESRWKLDRLKRMEAALVQQMTSQDTTNTDPDAVIVAAMLAGNANVYAVLQRYSAAAERSYYKAKHELEQERAQQAERAKPVTRPVQNEPKPQEPRSLNLLDYMLKPGATLEDLRKLADAEDAEDLATGSSRRNSGRAA